VKQLINSTNRGRSINASQLRGRVRSRFISCFVEVYSLNSWCAVACTLGKMQTYWLATGHHSDDEKRESAGGRGSLTESSHHNLASNPVLLKSQRIAELAQGAASLRNRRSQLLSGSKRLPSTRLPAHSGELATTMEEDISAESNDIGPASSRPSITKDVFERRGSMHTSASNRTLVVTSKKTTRLVRWNAEVLSRLLKQIVARRNAMTTLSKDGKQSGTPASYGMTNDGLLSKDHDGSTEETKPDDSSRLDSSDENSDSDFGSSDKRTVLEEVKEIIHLPTFNAEAARSQEDPYKIQLDEAVKDQLLAYVTEVASMYR
jgi:hypothetical protein